MAQLGFDFVEAAAAAPRSNAPRRRAPRNDRPAPPQLGLPIDSPSTGEVSIEPTIRGQVRVESALREKLGKRVIVTLTKNRSTMISFKERRGVLYLRLHAIFSEATLEVLHAVASFITGHASRRQSHMIDEWIEANRHLVKQPRPEDPPIQPIGESHDLQAIFDRLNASYFEGAIGARITWTRAAKKQRRNSIRMGSYCDEQRLIRIHPALDQAFVPAYFVASVVFHEMLHEIHGAPEGPSGRRCVHPPAFLEEEKRFADYDRARKWELKHLNRLLRY